jgi:hypothetical protein
MKKTLPLISGAAAALACSPAAPTRPQLPKPRPTAMIKRDFKTKGIATTDRLHEDGVQQAVCNRSGDNPPKDIAARWKRTSWQPSSIPPTAS